MKTRKLTKLQLRALELALKGDLVYGGHGTYFVGGLGLNEHVDVTTLKSLVKRSLMHCYTGFSGNLNYGITVIGRQFVEPDHIKEMEQHLADQKRHAENGDHEEAHSSQDNAFVSALKAIRLSPENADVIAEKALTALDIEHERHYA